MKLASSISPSRSSQGGCGTPRRFSTFDAQVSPRRSPLHRTPIEILYCASCHSICTRFAPRWKGNAPPSILRAPATKSSGRVVLGRGVKKFKEGDMAAVVDGRLLRVCATASGEEAVLRAISGSAYNSEDKMLGCHLGANSEILWWTKRSYCGT